MKEIICELMCKMTLENVNELLIKEGHAVEYHGGKR